MIPFLQSTDSSESTNYTFKPALQDISLKRYVGRSLLPCLSKHIFCIDVNYNIWEVMFSPDTVVVVISTGPVIDASSLFMICNTTWNFVEKCLDVSCVHLYLLPQLSPQ